MRPASCSLHGMARGVCAFAGVANGRRGQGGQGRPGETGGERTGEKGQGREGRAIMTKTTRVVAFGWACFGRSVDVVEI